MTTMGKYRHLSRCSNEDGHFTILAIDHRGNLIESLNKYAPKPLDDVAFTTYKQQIMGGLLPEASAVLVDPAYGIGTGITGQVIDGQVGLLAPVEVTDYNIHPSQRDIVFLPNWSIAKIKRVGGDGVKLLLPYHPEADSAPSKREIVEKIVAQCEQHDIPFFLEPVAYSLDPARKLPGDEFTQIVVHIAGLFSKMGVDVLKLQFPIDSDESYDEDKWTSACAEVDAASEIPWTILSAGVDYDTFAQQARIACEAGASGVIVGRAVWAEAVELQGQEREEFIHTTARKRMHELANICQKYATPWYERVSLPDAGMDWYVNYSE